MSHFHFYTLDPKGETAQADGYVLEGIACLVWDPAKPNPPGTVAFNRWVDPKSGAHFYTTDPTGEFAPANGLKPEGNVGYVYPSTTPPDPQKYQPFYRFYKNSTEDHFYTLEKSGEEALTQNDPYKVEGIACYVPIQGDGLLPLYRWYQNGAKKVVTPPVTTPHASLRLSYCFDPSALQFNGPADSATIKATFSCVNASGGSIISVATLEQPEVPFRGPQAVQSNVLQLLPGSWTFSATAGYTTIKGGSGTLPNFRAVTTAITINQGFLALRMDGTASANGICV